MTLDSDLHQQIRARMRERGTTFKETVNELLRRGLQSSQPTEPYTTPTFAMATRADVDLDKAMGLAAAMEDEETVRKLERAK